MKRKKSNYVDDGHTIYNMSNVESPLSPNKGKDNVGLTRAEKRAAIKAAFKVYLPIFLGVIACFALICVLMYFWIR